MCLKADFDFYLLQTIPSLLCLCEMKHAFSWIGKLLENVLAVCKGSQHIFPFLFFTVETQLKTVFSLKTFAHTYYIDKLIHRVWAKVLNQKHFFFCFVFS